MVVDPAADPSDPAAPLLTITELVTNSVTGLVDMVNATDGDDPPVITTIPIVSDATSEVDSLNNQAGGGVLPGDTGGDYALPAAWETSLRTEQEAPRCSRSRSGAMAVETSA
ncbi:MAG: hypothetical protein P8Q97_09605 [Myxococcota bacterium]|nr:hypothetical protein [Myxococcota bacterium]